MAYALVLAVLLCFHEPWRDEWQAFMLGRDSHSLAELWNNRYYDAHPPLWHFLLFVASKISRSVVTLKVLHWLIATAAAAVWLAYCPLPWRYRVALVFGYFLLYEYAVISRNYALGVLWLWLWCALWTRRPGDYPPLGLIYLAMAFTNVHIFLLGSSLWLALGFEFLLSRQRRAATTARAIFMTLACIGLGCALFLKFTYLPPDTGYPRGFDLTFNLARLLRAVSGALTAFAPLPGPGIQFHDTSYFHNWDLRQTAALGLGLWLAAGSCLVSPLARAYFLAGSGLMFFFTYAKFMGFHRHAGHFYLVWLACLWLDPKPRHLRWVAAVAALHLSMAVRASWLDLRYPFTPAGQTARFLRERGLQDRPIVGMPDGVASAVAGNLDRTFYYPDCRRWGTFLIWDNRRDLQPYPPPDLVGQIEEVARQRGWPVVVVSGDRLTGRGRMQLAPGIVLEELGRFAASIVTSEQYFVYLIQLAGPKDTRHDFQPDQPRAPLDGGVSSPANGDATPPGPSGAASGGPGSGP